MVLQARSVSPECANAVANHLFLSDLTFAEFDASVDESARNAYPCKSADEDVGDACI